MNGYKQRDIVIPTLGGFLLFLAVFYQHLTNGQDILRILQEGEPTTTMFEKTSGAYPTYQLWGAEGAFIGYGVITDASGYGGKVGVLSIVDGNGTIKKVVILKDYETPAYKDKVLSTGLLEKIGGRHVQESLVELDGVSGATMTTEAILSAVQKGATQLGNEQLGLEIPPLTSVMKLNWKQGLSILILVIGMIGCQFHIKKLRPWLLVVSVIMIGFVLKYSVTFSQYTILLIGQLPIWIECPLWYLFVPGILLITLLWGRNFYCSWVCPFGAVQEGIYKSLNLFNFYPSTELRKKIRSMRWYMLWAVTMTALIFNQPGITGYEPFSAFFDSTGTTAQWIILGIVLLVSMALPRFWCLDFCPVGLMLNSLVRLRRTVKKRLQRRSRGTPAAKKGSFIKDCRDCSAQKAAATRQDALYLVAALVVNALIIVSLMENLGIF